MTRSLGPLPKRGGRLTAIFLVAVAVAAVIGTIVATRDSSTETAAEAVQGALDESTTDSVFHPPGGPLAGTAAADFDVELLEGGTFDLAEHFNNDGRPLVLNFWASWCPPCRAEMPDFDRVAVERTDIRVIGIAVEDDPGAATAFGNEIGVRYGLGIDHTGTIAASYPYLGLPTTWFIDSEGIIVRQWTGLITYEDLLARIDADLSG